ncbi:hypothetical protein [Vallitalea guaymasensis]|uniref:hypothetical protein n=1 Tax=Vallitalea guaymasensis TaxID=1185412 RepID=UPI000DE3489A|nr:hypothetical protein [Vallitalea guaymasensis]
MNKINKLYIALFIIIIITQCITIIYVSNISRVSNNQIDNDLIKESKEVFANLKTVINQLEKYNSNKDRVDIETVIDKDESIYDLPFFEFEVIESPRTMYLKKSTTLKAYPYQEADDINNVYPNYVAVYSVVKNMNAEEWALIEFIDYSYAGKTAFGYVRFDDLISKDYTDYLVCNKESINDLYIGDYIEKAISLLGRDYKRIKNELEWIYEYEGISIKINPTSNTIESITITTKGYKTEENVGIGDNALKAIKLYKNSYKMNNKNILYKHLPETVFELEERYVIQLGYDTEDLNEQSKIDYISLYFVDNIYE